MLLWIARPAANAELPQIGSRQAVVELVIGLAVAMWTARHAPLLVAALALIVRLAIGVSYSKWGGIQRISYHATRIIALLAALFIASLPESSLYVFGR